VFMVNIVMNSHTWIVIPTPKTGRRKIKRFLCAC